MTRVLGLVNDREEDDDVVVVTNVEAGGRLTYAAGQATEDGDEAPAEGGAIDYADLSVEYVESSSNVDAFPGYWDSVPPAAVEPDGVSDDMHGKLVIAGNSIAGAMMDVIANEASELEKVLKLPNTQKVLTASNRNGTSFDVVLVSDGEETYSPRVFFGGKELGFLPTGFISLQHVPRQECDSALFSTMMANYVEVVGPGVKEIKIQIEAAMRAFARFEGDSDALSRDEIMEMMGIDFALFNKVVAEAATGTFFKQLMVKTPAGNMVGHMVEGPQRDITGFLDIVRDPQDFGEAEMFLKKLHSGVARFHSIVTEFLPLLAKHGILPQALNLKKMVEMIKHCIGDEEAQSKIEIHIDPNLEGVFPIVLAPILENAIFNAHKFGATRIRVSAKVEEYEDNGERGQRVVLSVEDNGKAVAASTLARLFKSAVSSDTGSGTGSFIAGKIVTDMRASEVPGSRAYEIGLDQDDGVDAHGRALKRFRIGMATVNPQTSAYIVKAREELDSDGPQSLAPEEIDAA